MRQAIAHDHCYSLPPEKAPSYTNPSCLSSISIDQHIPLPTQSVTVAPKLAERFCIETFVDDDHAITFYTSFPSYAHFMILCYNYLGNAVNHLAYPGSSADVAGISRVKSQRILSPKNEFFLTLCRLRCGLMEQDLAYRFHISQATVSRIFTAWINFIINLVNCQYGHLRHKFVI